MTWSRLLVCLCVGAFGIPSAFGQDRARLQIEVIRNGVVIARPELRVAPGSEGRLSLDSEYVRSPLLAGLRERITITPTVRDDGTALAFDIRSGDRQFRPSLVLPAGVSGSIEWRAADGQPVRLTVSLSQ